MDEIFNKFEKFKVGVVLKNSSETEVLSVKRNICESAEDGFCHCTICSVVDENDHLYLPHRTICGVTDGNIPEMKDIN